MTLGLNVLNEELFGKIISTKMLGCVLDTLDLRNTAIILTNATGQITFVHSRVKNVFVGEETLVGQPMSVIIEDFDKLDKKFKNIGFSKGIDVKIKFGNDTEHIVTLNVAIPSIFSKSEGVAYILTLNDTQVASISDFNKKMKEKNAFDEVANFESNCLKFKLTIKEKEIASLLAKGYSQKKIADRFFRSPHTIAKHIQNMFIKVKVKSKSDLVSVLKFSIQSE
jgi:DNA-binding CsgD family transcriptional regulator